MSVSKKLNPRPNGFLLFELIVAVAVLSLSLTLISRSFISSLTALQTSAHFFKAGMLLEKKMLELEEKPLSSEKEEGTFEEFGETFHWTVEMKEMEDTPLYETLVSVGWDALGRERRLAVATYLPRHHEE